MGTYCPASMPTSPTGSIGCHRSARHQRGLPTRAGDASSRTAPVTSRFCSSSAASRVCRRTFAPPGMSSRSRRCNPHMSCTRMATSSRRRSTRTSTSRAVVVGDRSYSFRSHCCRCDRDGVGGVGPATMAGTVDADLRAQLGWYIGHGFTASNKLLGDAAAHAGGAPNRPDSVRERRVCSMSSSKLASLLANRRRNNTFSSRSSTAIVFDVFCWSNRSLRSLTVLLVSWWTTRTGNASLRNSDPSSATTLSGAGRKPNTEQAVELKRSVADRFPNPARRGRRVRHATSMNLVVDGS